MNVIKDYFTDRTIFKDKREGLKINVGVPQGSVLGPTLWNVMYDGILGIEVPDGVQLIAYADDLTIAVADRNLQDLTTKANQSIVLVGEWLQGNGLQLASEKTEAILLRFDRRKQEVAVDVFGTRIVAKNDVRYLGITLDSAVSLGPHIRAAAIKTEKTVTALSRLMPNIGGAGEKQCRVLCSVAHSIILYGAPIWALSLHVGSYRSRLQSVQRKMALRVCQAYRTVSYDAATVLGSTIPIYLMALERKNVYNMRITRNADRAAEHSRMLDRWQEEWSNGSKGAWKRHLIRDVRPWATRKYGVMDFHLSQAMTGHGAFKSYTLRIGKSEEDLCEQCRISDTAEHVLFYCVIFEDTRV